MTVTRELKMNDFTKEELHEVLYRLENEPPWLTEKLRNMIHNYCEHKRLSENATNLPLHCLDCGEKFE